MTEIRSEVIEMIEQLPEEKIINVFDFLKSLIKSDSEDKMLSESMMAYHHLQKYRKRGSIDIDYKKELSAELTAKYENIG